MPEGLVLLSPARRVASVLGLVYSVLGMVGFAISGFDGFAATRGDVLVFFTVNPLQNLIHLALGWWLVRAAAAGEQPARRAARLAVLLLAGLGALGVAVLQPHPELNVIYANPAVHAAHLASAAGFGIWLAVEARRA